MLKADPKERLTAAQALEYPFFKERSNLSNDVIQIAVDEFKYQNEAVKDTKNNPLMSCTPVMAGRKLNQDAPQSPFLTHNKNNSNVANTPIMRKVTIDD